MKILFSGRFDPPHPGHIITILNLAAKYEEVVVVILDYDERDYAVAYVKKVFEDIFKTFPHSVAVKVNKTHFAKITKKEYEEFGCDLYAAGNHKVLRHLEKLGIKTIYTERSADYSASKYERP